MDSPLPYRLERYKGFFRYGKADLDSQGNATVTGTATLKMNDGTTATISGLKDDYHQCSHQRGNHHVTMTRLGGGTVDLNLTPILEKYSLATIIW